MSDSTYLQTGTTEFEEWLAEEAPETLEEAFDLIEAVRHETDCGRYNVDHKDYGLVVSSSGSLDLILAGVHAEKYFLQIIHQKYVAPMRKRRTSGRDSV